MKQSDIVTIVFVAALGMLATIIIANAVLNDPDMVTKDVRTIEVVESDVKEPDAEVFNAGAINPTVEVYVGNCVDADGDGVLNQEEREACNQNVIEIDGADGE